VESLICRRVLDQENLVVDKVHVLDSEFHEV